MREQLQFFADLGILDGQDGQITITNTAAFQTEDLDAYDSNCNDVFNAKAVLMANLFNYGSDVILEVTHPESYHNDLDNQRWCCHVGFRQTQSRALGNNVMNLDVELLKKQNTYNELSKKNAKLKGQIQEKVFVTTALQNELRRLKGKFVLDNATTIAPGMFKLDIEPLSHRLKNNRDAHEDYLKKTIEKTNTIRGLVERARKQNPSEPLLDSTCKFTKHIQELLVYVSQTCPSFTKPSEKLVAVTPMNKVKKVRFSEPLISLSKIHKQVESSKTPYSNTHVLPSTGLKSSTSASRS
ncbi:hypothetical protein Tco_0468842 [Tanacetum coccineum]